MRTPEHTARLLRIASRAWDQYKAASEAYGPIDARTLLAFQNFKTFRAMADGKGNK